jgi:zinc transporter
MQASSPATPLAGARKAFKARYRNWFGLVCAYRLDGKGGGEPLTWTDLDAPTPRPDRDQHERVSSGGAVWIHLDIKHTNALRWLKERSGLDPMTVDALAAPRVNPRIEQRDGSMLMVLKGVNFTPGALPTDMVSLRLWTDGNRVITCRREPVRATSNMSQRLQEGQGPMDAGGIITDLANLMVAHMEDMINDQLLASHRIGRLSDSKPTEDLVSELAHLRRVMIRMRRFLGPQRRALAQLAATRQPWLSDSNRILAREVVHQCIQYIEGLDAAQEISEITQDEILQRSTEKTERRLFSLTVITAIFLPLTFITGLLGVNLAGIPDAEDPWSFLILCILLGALVGAQLWLLHRKGWL